MQVAVVVGVVASHWCSFGNYRFSDALTLIIPEERAGLGFYGVIVAEASLWFHRFASSRIGEGRNLATSARLVCKDAAQR